MVSFYVFRKHLNAVIITLAVALLLALALLVGLIVFIALLYNKFNLRNASQLTKNNESEMCNVSLTQSYKEVELWKTRYVFYESEDNFEQRFDKGIVHYMQAYPAQFKVSKISWIYSMEKDS